MPEDFDSYESDIDSIGFTDEDRAKFADGTLQMKMMREIGELSEQHPSLRALADTNFYEEGVLTREMFDKACEISKEQARMRNQLSMGPFSLN